VRGVSAWEGLLAEDGPAMNRQNPPRLIVLTKEK
jgi:hypothetical protein